MLPYVFRVMNQQAVYHWGMPGRFPGMAEIRTFRVVIVVPVQGTDIGHTKAPDKVVIYDGKKQVI